MVLGGGDEVQGATNPGKPSDTLKSGRAQPSCRADFGGRCLFLRGLEWYFPLLGNNIGLLGLGTDMKKIGMHCVVPRLSHSTCTLPS